MFPLMGNRIPSTFTTDERPWGKRVMALRFYSNLEDLDKALRILLRFPLSFMCLHFRPTMSGF